MNAMIMIAQLLLSLSILVAVHEMGHLLAAKYFGMRVEQFSIGFPPKIWSFRKGETEYALSAIPLGGYVKISGMIDESLDTEAMKQEPQPWEFRSKPAWQRLIVMLGGIIVNVVVGILIFIGITFFIGDANLKKDVINANGGFHVGSVGQELGLRTGDKIVKINGRDYDYFVDLTRAEALLSTDAHYTVDRDGKLIEIKIPDDFIQKFNKKENAGNFLMYRFPPAVGQVSENSIAENVGLQKGDLIVEVNGTPVKYFDEVYDIVHGTNAESVSFKVKRGNEILSFDNQKFTNKKKQIGFAPAEPTEFLEKAEEKITYGFSESVVLGTKRAFTTLFVQIKAFGKIISGVLNPTESLSGPIGIAQAFGGEFDWARFWTLTGVLSLVLAFMNLLPIPALDGGHVMFLTYEIVSRRKPSDRFLEGAQKFGMVFLLALMVFIFANDIVKWAKGSDDEPETEQTDK
jgi:regulator of sigma E protease